MASGTEKIFPALSAFVSKLIQERRVMYFERMIYRKKRRYLAQEKPCHTMMEIQRQPWVPAAFQW